MEATIWVMIPPILAIVVSLITKQVNLSLLVGIVVGTGICTHFDVFAMVTMMLEVMGEKVHQNIGVLIFIILLGMIVYLMNLSGATHHYAQWASNKLKTKRQTMLASMFLGILIFLDDYFNCLTVGTVMRPITDRNRISREKLAYIIDCTAAPVCIIAPISSWAAAVSSSLPDGSTINGFSLFIQSIFCNYYSLLTLLMVLMTSALCVDFGKMRKYEELAQKGELDYSGFDADTADTVHTHGKILDLVLPVVFLIGASIVSMLYTGGYFDGGISISTAFANCDAITGLAMGGVYTVVFIALLYLPRRIVTPVQFCDGLIEGFKNMVPAALILTFAWTLGGICGESYLNVGGVVAGMVERNGISLNLVPVIFFLTSLALAFSTGTSWGTFAILLPITVSVFKDQMTPLMVLSTAAVLGGSVCGDHISPISDTTILSSTGAGCDHINHVATQLQYGLVVAGITAVCYLAAGVLENGTIGLVIGVVSIVILTVTLALKNVPARQK